MDELLERLTQIQFDLRNRLWGRARLRNTFPKPEPDQRREGEAEFYRMMLERAITPEHAAAIDVVWDIGCRNWSYARAVHETFVNARLIGVELDGGRRYWNLHRRIDQARAHALELSFNGGAAHVVAGDFREAVRDASTDETHAFCFFFPFVSARPSRRWGVPFAEANFLDLLTAARSAVPGAAILSSHQGEWEAELAREFYTAAAVSVRESVLSPAVFGALWPSPYQVHVFSSCDKISCK